MEMQQANQIRPVAPQFVRTVPPVVKVSKTATLKLQGDSVAISNNTVGSVGIPAHAIAFATGNLDKVVDHVLGPNKVVPKEQPKGIKGFFAKLLG